MHFSPQRSAQTDSARHQLDYERQNLLDMMYAKLYITSPNTSIKPLLPSHCFVLLSFFAFCCSLFRSAGT